MNALTQRQIEAAIADAKPVAKTGTKAKAPTKGKAKAPAKGKAAARKAPRWRETASDKTPLPSLYNARQAVLRLGIQCSYDLFKDRMLIGQRDGIKVSVDHALIGDVTDDNLLMLRQIISREFGFDPTDRFVRDAVRTLARENCYDPILDMLAKAQAGWDGTARIDRLAADYFNCEDTPLNAAFGRKFIIGMVARARRPGCKFDTIAVFESPEGFNKSTALRILAGDDYFSDEPVIGHGSREVQEHIGGIWLHESADLAGMSKREVETVKAFASRQVDRARPAYGHQIKMQPRRCVMAGTTNSSEYLQSQTGNRRFWPMAVQAPVDIEKLCKDRLQLLGEAAFYESQGESLFLDETLWGDARDQQEQRRVRDAWEDTVAESEAMWFHIVTVDGEERISTEALINDVLKIPVAQQTTGISMRLSNVMKHLGWQRRSNGNISINRQQMKGYWRPAPPKPPKEKAPKGTRPKALPPSEAERKAAKGVK